MCTVNQVKEERRKYIPIEQTAGANECMQELQSIAHWEKFRSFSMVGTQNVLTQETHESLKEYQEVSSEMEIEPASNSLVCTQI